MEDMTGSTFTRSPIERGRRRSTGPALTLVVGTGGAPSIERDTPPWHPAHEGFTPDGAAGHGPARTVRDSEPGSPTLRSTSRGSASPDRLGVASPGSGPIDQRGMLIEHLARFLEEHAGEGVSDDPAPSGIRQIR